VTAPVQRRRDPTILTQGWEIAVVVIGIALIAVALAALAGLGCAAALFGRGWVWPYGVDTIGRTLGGLASGQPSRGLPPVDAARAAAPAPTYLCVLAFEAAVIAGGAAAGMAIARRMRNDGMATRRDAEHALGLSELRRARAIIRPDLYAGRRGETAALGDRAGSFLRPLGRRRQQ
jgi:hypothetical protein